MFDSMFAFSSCDNNFKQIQELTYNHNIKYFNKYNIDYSIFYNELSDSIFSNQNNMTQYHCYLKFLKLKELMDNRNDIKYFYVFDSDIVICDFNIDIRVFTKFSNKPLLLCSTSDCSSDMFWNINAGSMIVRNCNIGKSIIEYYINIAKTNSYTINDQVLWQKLLMMDKFIQDNTSIFPKNSFNHGDKDLFLHHDCYNSTSNQILKYCLDKKLHNLQDTINHLNNK